MKQQLATDPLSLHVNTNLYSNAFIYFQLWIFVMNPLPALSAADSDIGV
jgi:hypothetical protein